MPSNRHSWNLIALACLLFALMLSVPNALKAQTTMASLEGLVTDSSGAVIPGATVELVNEGTNVKQIAKTDERGYYFFKFLQPANYRLTVTVSGFATFVRAGMVLQVQQAARVDVALKPGTVSTKVEVTGEAPRLDTVNATQGQVADLNEMLNLPLGRNPLAAINLSPNVVGVGGQPQGAQNFSANGGRLDTSDVLLDGVTIDVQDPNSGAQDTLFTPMSDEIQEMKVQTNTFSAEYGLSGNVIITMASRSGTNQLHGDIFEFHNDSALNANGFYANKQGTAKSVSRSNKGGGVVGGPVYIPHVYDGRNKTFFFEHYERLFVPGNPTTITETVPTALEKAGDFSASKLSDGTAVTVYNPATDACVSGCGTSNAVYQRSPYANNGTYIDPSTWNPVATHVIPFYPSPTSTGTGPSHASNFYWIGSYQSHWYEEDVRIDHNFTPNQRLAARYSRQPTSSLTNSNPWGAGNYMVPEGYTGSGSMPQHASVNYTNVINPTTILNMQYGVIRYYSTSGIIGDNRSWTYGDFGYTNTIGTNRPPGFFVQNYANIGPSVWASDYGSGAGTAQTTHQLSGTLTKVKGIHTFKAGGEGRFVLMNQNSPGVDAAAFDICLRATQQNPLVSVNGQGNALASLMAGWGGGNCMGGPNNVSTNAAIATAAQSYGFFVNDDVRVTRKLTLNLGFRYELNVPLTERHNRLTYTDPDLPQPDLSRSGLNITGGDVYTTAYHRHPFNTDWHDFAPRFGFAYQIAPKTVARGGYGLFYGLSSGQITGEMGDGYTATTSYTWSTDSGITQNASLSNPFPNGITAVTGSGMGSQEELGTWQVHGPIPQWNKTPRIEQWSLSIERELPGNSVVEVAYTGSHAYHMGDGIIRDILSTYPSEDLAKYGTQLTESVANPLYGYYPASAAGATLNTPTVPLFQTLMKYPQFQRIHGRPGPPQGLSFYNSGFVRFTRRMSQGLQFSAHYTWSHALSNSETADDNNLDWLMGAINGNGSVRAYAQDWDNLKLDKSVTLNDITHRIVGDFVYELPFGHGHGMGAHWNRGLDSVAGGWKMSGIVTLQSGPPIAPHLSGGSLSNNANFQQRPNLLRNPATSGSVEERLSNYLNADAFSTPATLTFGNAPRVMSFARAPGWRSMDASLFKQFYFTENRARYLEFRAEASNLFNHPIFGYPDSTVGDSSFGIISSTVNGSRGLTLAMKLFF